MADDMQSALLRDILEKQGEMLQELRAIRDELRELRGMEREQAGSGGREAGQREPAAGRPEQSEEPGRAGAPDGDALLESLKSRNRQAMQARRLAKRMDGKDF
ncbi:hypothetical protein [Desulfohalovibrio reitneri]|uniref:hypothetical protein n=1 Tax=Desulfohalovibrio reitneri TaxID=1307759 RepID=UPI0004A6C092|nr:hypothetical protein [Desulfohalovibrio reitneri]